jgi:hypothetical protein
MSLLVPHFPTTMTNYVSVQQVALYRRVHDSSCLPVGSQLLCYLRKGIIFKIELQVYQLAIWSFGAESVDVVLADPLKGMILLTLRSKLA